MSLNSHIKLPAVFGRFVLLRRISRGGMGEIFLAKLGEIQGFEKPIVIKKILPDLAEDQEFLQRFIEEAQIAIKLSHGNIVPVYEVGKVDDQYFLALQYVEGRDLRSLLNRCEERKERLPPDLCLLLVRELTNGLAYAHRVTDESGQPLDLVHCDISPPNILVSWEGEVKIIDFGIAKSAIQRAVDEHVGFGKFGYMAPEQLLRGTTVDRRTDIYSTGVILHELLTGKRVFNFPPGTDYRRVAREVTAGNIKPPSERDLKLSDQFDTLVMRALRTNPEERYASAEEFRDEVQQHLYSMNPTISADSLAAFMQKIFADEHQQHRQMLRSLSQTDLAPYRTELADGSIHTVSFALAGLWTKRVSHEVSGLSVVTTDLRKGPRPTEIESRQKSTSKPPVTGTRRMSALEQKAAADLEEYEDLSRSTYTVLKIRRRRTLAMTLSTLGVLAAAAAIVWVLGSDDMEQQPADQIVQQPREPVVQVLPAQDDLAATNTEPEGGTLASAPTVNRPPAKRQTASRPKIKNVARGVKKQSRRHKKPRRKKKRPAPAPPPEPAPISPALVQAKFRKVRREYKQFTGSYGQQLDGEWQKILFSNTYGNMDENKYRRLNEMLDDLRKKMKQIKDGS